jgi:cytochrome bd ubiquinol oxidase subunit I
VGKLTAVTFAIGAVSGTALSFELGLLWPRFMAFAGPLIGPAFALEGYAFFVEAIFLGLYLYGWERLSARAHWLCGWGVAVSGALSGILVLATNAWMQHPVGFRVGPDGMPLDVNAWAVLTNPAWPLMAAHSTLSTYQAVGFAAAGAYAWALWRGGRPSAARYQQLGLAIGMLTASGAVVLQPVLGDLLAKRAHDHQPAKLAAMEGHFVTGRRAPLRIGGIPDVDRRETRYALEIPGMLSFLADHDVETEVAGLDRFPRHEWPNVVVTHVAFQIMAAAGVAMLVVALWYWWIRWRGRANGVAAPLPRALLLALVLCAPLGFIALEAGWIVTEVGRQPWVIYRVMRTADAVTPVIDVWGSLALFTFVYATLLMLLVFFLRRLASEEGAANAEH